jgi:DNA topoisomerase-1
MEFCEILPIVRENLKKDLSRPGFPQRKVLAAVVSLLEKINIRIGNSAYEKLYGSFGLTTLKNRHVKINGTTLQLSFKGKKGVRHNITFRNRRLARIIKGCRDIPGKELFEYYDENRNIHSVDSGMVNNYIREISEGDFTAKDFRTWAGTIHALRTFKEIGGFETQTEMNRKVNMMLDSVAAKLGNTRAVCKKYYVHPLIIDLYKEKELDKYLEELSPTESISNSDDYEQEEKVLVKILKDVSSQISLSDRDK